MTGLRPVSFKKGRASAPRLSPKPVPGKIHERFYTDAEKAVLIEHYPKGGLSAVASRLNHRTRSSLYAMAHKLGLSVAGLSRAKPIKPPADIDDILRREWPLLSGKGAVAALADRLELPRWWISGRARKLELVVTRRKEPPWTQAERDLMAKVPLHDLDKCAEVFRANGFRRSPTAISVMAKRMDLSRRAPHENLSATAAAKILGLDNKSLSAILVAGHLKAGRRGSKRLPQQGGDAWDITRADLRRYVIDNLAGIDIRKVDKVSFVHLLVGDDLFSEEKDSAP